MIAGPVLEVQAGGSSRLRQQVDPGGNISSSG